MRQALGDNPNIMLDANQAWELKTAIEAARRFADAHPHWLEEPLQWYDNLQAMRMLRQHTHLPLARGGNAHHCFDARELLEPQAIDIMPFDGTKNGGSPEWRKIAGMCSRTMWMSHRITIRKSTGPSSRRFPRA